jgi:hypothetical protein
MNYFAAMLALACASAGAAPPQQQSAAGGLRQTLQQYHPASGASPRELTPVERAELRRQLSEQPRPQPRRR